jgi:hypothetical protein
MKLRWTGVSKLGQAAVGMLQNKPACGVYFRRTPTRLAVGEMFRPGWHAIEYQQLSYFRVLAILFSSIGSAELVSFRQERRVGLD